MTGRWMVWAGMLIGSTIGSILPYLWNGSPFSYLLWSSIGAILGIWIGFKAMNGTF